MTDAGSARARVAAAARELEAVVREVDPSALSPAEAVGLLAGFARAAKAAGAGQAWVAGRVDDTGAARRLGHRSAQDVVASRSGSSWGQANAVVETGKALGAHAATAAALRSGRISVDQAHAIARAAAVVPSAEAELLAVAPTTTLRGLQRRARDVRLTVEMNAPGAYARLVAAQSLTYRTDDGGMCAGEFRLAPDVGALVTSVLEAQADRHYRAASRAERHERSAAWFRADALTSLVTGRDPAEVRAADAAADAPPETAGSTSVSSASSASSPPSSSSASPPPRPSAGSATPPSAETEPGPAAALPTGRRSSPRPRAEVVFHVSYEAYRRGSVAPGERSVAVGVGPVAIERVRDVIAHDDPLVRAVLVDGGEVTKIHTFGRHLPAELVAALTARAVAADGTLECSVPGCDATAHLQWDHRRPVHQGGPTSAENVQPLCGAHHREKSERELRARRRRPGSGRDGPDP